MGKTKDTLQFKLGVYCDNGNKEELQLLLASHSDLTIFPEGEDNEVYDYVLPAAQLQYWEVVKILFNYYIAHNIQSKKVDSDEWLHARSVLSDVVSALEEWGIALPEALTESLDEYLLDPSDDTSESDWDVISLPDKDTLDVMGSDATDSTDSTS